MIEREKLISMVQDLKDGKQDAAAVIYETFHKKIYYQIYETVNRDAELAADLTQDTFIYVLEKIHDLNDNVAFVTWIQRIAASKCKDYSIKRKELLVDEYEDGYSIFDKEEEYREEFIPGEALDKEDLKRIILDIINKLPQEQREAILLRYFNEISVKEIAYIQGVSEGTVKSRLNYGRKALKDAVETYEKKNDIRLHCAGVVPMLLWFFRAYRSANHLPITYQTANSVFSVAEAAAEATSAATAASTVTSTVSTAGVVKTGVAAGAKAAGKTVAAKAIAAAAAATVAVGGIAYSVFAKPDIDTWSGYGDALRLNENRFEITVDEMDDSFIQGHLEVSYLYDIEHDTAFEGSGTEKDGKIVYEISFETPKETGMLNIAYTNTTLEYDKDTQVFSFDDFYDVTLHPDTGEEEEVLFRDKLWKGTGENNFHISRSADLHEFELTVYEMRKSSISGKLAVFYNGTLEHESEFTGRGYTENGTTRYEIRLENPRIEKQIITVEMDTFWLLYTKGNDRFEIPFPHAYQTILYAYGNQPIEPTVANELAVPVPETTEPTEPPTTEPPETEPPATEAPAAAPSVAEPPADMPAVTEPPEAVPPVTEPPVVEPPVTEPPVTEPPVTEPAVTEPAVTEPPATEPPAVEPPAAPTEPPKPNFVFNVTQVGDVVENTADATLPDY